jgi:hypothetical protein
MMQLEIYGSTMALFGTMWVKSKVIKDLQELPAHQAYKDLQAQQVLPVRQERPEPPD